MSVPVGITVPKMLPITGTATLPLIAYYTYLSLRVSTTRVKTNTIMGDRSKTLIDNDDEDPLFIATRCHANFAENVPLAILMGAIVEMNGGNRKILSGSFAALFLFRLIHVELGLRGPKSRSLGRPLGHIGTLSFIAGMAGYSMYLVKGYWGF